MNKVEMIQAMAQKNGMSRKDNEKALLAFMDLVADALAEGEKVSLVGFGTFEARQRKAREAKVPQTQETVQVPACRVPAFRAGKSLKEKVK